MNGLAERVLEQPFVYRWWQAPFAERKLAPLTRQGALRDVRRVLDVGCGPGTNARHFTHAEYVGIDINPRYIESAQRRFKGKFLVADVTTFTAAPDERFDCILVNSLLHHIPNREVRRLLAHLATLLTEDGAIHILELVLPPRPSIARALARLDRGDYPRPLAEWELLCSAHFDTVVCTPYPLGAFGISLWDMIYYQGRRR
jgi:SAM-dependent methyltransferase